jgi:hypothetical protein
MVCAASPAIGQLAMPGRMTISPEENNNMCVEHSVLAEGSDDKLVEPTQRPGKSSTQKEDGLWISK